MTCGRVSIVILFLWKKKKKEKNKKFSRRNSAQLTKIVSIVYKNHQWWRWNGPVSIKIKLSPSTTFDILEQTVLANKSLQKYIVRHYYIVET